MLHEVSNMVMNTVDPKDNDRLPSGKKIVWSIVGILLLVAITIYLLP